METPKYPASLNLEGLRLLHQGKTRDTYATESPRHLLVVATDRLSTHNIVHESLIPEKGKVLSALTVFWIIKFLQPMKVLNHLVAHGSGIYKFLPGQRGQYPRDLHHRAVVVRKLDMIPVEFIHRGYLAGSLWKSYSKGEANPYGIDLSPGLRLMSALNPILFTPTDKSETDEPIDAGKTEAEYQEVATSSRRLFLMIREYLNSLGIELVDSKFEYGRAPGIKPVVADEIATPDSSRFCELSEIAEGSEPRWLDKQLARDEAERIWGAGKRTPLKFEGPIVANLAETYRRIFKRITGLSLDEFQARYLE